VHGVKKCSSCELNSCSMPCSHSLFARRCLLQKLRQTDGAMWSLSELTQAVVIVAHVHALSIFLAGCGLYSTDAVLALLDSASCSELPTDKPSLPTCTSAHLSLTVVSIVSDILYLRWVNVSPHFLTRSATFFEH